LKAVPDRHAEEQATGRAFFAEGDYCAYSGWTGFEATHTGPDWLGLPVTNKRVNMRCIDLWRREGDFLAENWVFLDIIDILLQLGVDIFDRLKNRKHLIKKA